MYIQEKINVLLLLLSECYSRNVSYTGKSQQDVKH